MLDKMVKHRDVMNDELMKQECEICFGTFFRLNIHHINGNRKDNNKENLLCVCDRCHSKIHLGLTHKDNNLDEKVKTKLQTYRKIWLQNQLIDLGNSRIEEILKRELINSSITKYPYRLIKKCHFCNKKNNLIYVINKKFNKDVFSKEQKQKMSIIVCKKHYQDKDNDFLKEKYMTIIKV
jgi:hypothetical protein